MPDYRLYRLDRRSGRITSAENLHADDDAAAIHRVRLRGRSEAMELWCGARKVCRFDGAPEAATVSDGDAG